MHNDLSNSIIIKPEGLQSNILSSFDVLATVPTIIAISGHRTEKNIYKYIEADGMEHAMMMKKLLTKGINGE